MVAKKNNSMYFDLGNQWNEIATKYNLGNNGADISKKIFELFNKPALDDAIAGHKTIIFINEPTSGVSLQMEFKYISKHGKGYVYDATAKTFTYIGE